MTNGINLTRKDKPRRPIVNASETIKLLASGSPHAAVRPFLTGRRPGALSAHARFSRIPELPHRGGAWLFRRNDAEAGWRNWELTELRGGLGRRYRDARFDVLHQLYDVVSSLPPAKPAKPSDEQP